MRDGCRNHDFGPPGSAGASKRAYQGSNRLQKKADYELERLYRHKHPTRNTVLNACVKNNGAGDLDRTSEPDSSANAKEGQLTKRS